MAGSDSQKLQDRLQETVKLLTAGRGNREDTASVLTEAAERLNALEVSNRRLREEARGPAQAAWTKFMGDAVKGHLAHEMIALEFDDSQWQAVLDNCEDIADAALVRWKMRWMDGVGPVRRPRKGFGDPLPKAADGATPAEQSRASATADLDHLFDAAPRHGGPRMVDAASPPPKPPPSPASEAAPPAVPVAPAAAPAPKPEPPPAARPEPPKAPPAPAPVSPAPASPPPPAPPRERQPGDD